MAERIRLYEVGPRDGLQNEATIISVADKVRLINLLSQTGLDRIEATSFVSPKWVPQLADAAEVMAAITRQHGVRYASLTPNLKGYERARQAGADEVAVFASASEGFSQKNINCSIAESFERFHPILRAAKEDGIPVRGYVSCVIRCPYDGDVAPEAVAWVTDRLFQAGCYEVSLGDTIGAGSPDRVEALLQTLTPGIDAQKLAGHFHDTGGTAVANAEVALAFGVRTFDSAVAGLGGCPYAPGAKGNVSTRALVERFHELGYVTGVDLTKLADAEDHVARLGLGQH